MKRIALILCLILCMSLVSALAGTENVVTLNDYFHSDTYPLTKEERVFKVVGCSNYRTDLSDTTLMKYLEEVTGIRLEWTMYTNEAWSNTRQILLAGGELPDIFLCSANIDVVKYGMDEGLLYDITDLIKPNMPNFMAMHNEFPSVFDDIKQADGRIYGLPRVSSQYRVGSGLYINTRWLANLELEVPTTADELEQVLIAFRDKDANGNGDPNDEIPFTWNNDMPYTGLVGFFGIFGQPGACKTNDITFLQIDENGQLFTDRTTEAYKTGVKWLNKLYQEKLIDPEVFTQDTATFQAKGSAGDIYGCALAWRSQYAVGDNENANNFIPIMITYKDVEPQWGRYLANTYTLNQNVAEFNARLSEEDVVMLLKYFDIFYDPLFGEQCRRGPAGESSYYKEETGLLYQSPIPAEYGTLVTWIESISSQGYPYYSSRAYQDGFVQEGSSTYYLYQKDDFYWPYVKNQICPDINLGIEDSETVGVIRQDLNTYWKNMFALWVSGQQDIDGTWEEYLAQTERYGLPTYIRIMQEYYDKLYK